MVSAFTTDESLTGHPGTLYTKFLTWFDIQQDSHAIVIHISKVAEDLYSCTTGSKIASNPSPM